MGLGWHATYEMEHNPFHGSSHHQPVYHLHPLISPSFPIKFHGSSHHQAVKAFVSSPNEFIIATTHLERSPTGCPGHRLATLIKLVKCWGRILMEILSSKAHMFFWNWVNVGNIWHHLKLYNIWNHFGIFGIGGISYIISKMSIQKLMDLSEYGYNSPDPKHLI